MPLSRTTAASTDILVRKPDRLYGSRGRLGVRPAHLVLGEFLRGSGKQGREEIMASLTGQLLVSMPQMGDPFFSRSVVYLCSHDLETGAMGLIINKISDALAIQELYDQLGIERAASSAPSTLHFGGPVAPDRGFVLHSPDYQEPDSLRIDEAFALTTSLEILRAMANGAGPRQSLLALGYAGWGAGQLEAEIVANGWLVVAADAELVFTTGADSKWQRALAKLGVTPEMLSGESGRA